MEKKPFSPMFKRQPISELPAFLGNGLWSESDLDFFNLGEGREELKVEKDDAAYFRVASSSATMEFTFPDTGEISEHAKGLDLVSQLVLKAAEDVAKDRIQSFGAKASEQLTITVEDLIDSLASKRAPGRSITAQVMKALVAAFAQWLDGKGKKQAAIDLQVNAMKDRFAVAKMASYRQAMLEAITRNFENFAAEQELGDEYDAACAVLSENLAAAAEAQSEVDADDL